MAIEGFTIPLPAIIDESVQALIDEVKEVQALQITTEATNKLAVGIWDRVRSKWKALQDRKADETAGIKQALKTIEEPFNLQIVLLKNMDKSLSDGIKAYERKVDAERRRQQTELNRQVEQENAQRIADAKQTGDIATLQAPVIVEGTRKTVRTSDGGGMGRATMKAWGLKGILPDEDVETIPASDPRLLNIPRQYLVICKTRINAAAKAGIPVCDEIEVFDDLILRQIAKK